MKSSKKIELNLILKEMSNGKTPAEISKKYNIPKTTLSYSTTKLKKLGCIEKLPDYGQWKVLKEEVPIQPKDTSSPKFGPDEIRGHAFIWNVEFIESGFEWRQVVENYKKRYKSPKLSFKMICNNKVYRTIFNNRKIWLTKRGLTIYEPLDFFGPSSFTVKGTAVFEMDKLIKDLLKHLGQRFQYYRFKCSREHFAHVNNQMARQFNDNKQKIKVVYDGKWFWIDFSDGVNEEETNDAKISRQAQMEYREKVADGFNITRPTVITENFKKTSDMIGEVVKQRKEDFEAISKLSREIAVHIPAYEGMKLEVSKLNNILIAKEKQEEERHKEFLEAIRSLSKTK